MLWEIHAKLKEKLQIKICLIQFRNCSKQIQKLCRRIQVIVLWENYFAKAANSVWLIHTEADQSIIARLAIMKVITQDVSHPCWMKQIVIDEFNHIQENRIDAQKIFQEQEAQRMLRINQYEDKIRELHVIKNSYDSKVMAYYEAYREGTMSQQEYLDGRDSYILLQAKVDQDINDANEKLKELRREEVIGLEVFSFEGNGMRLKELTRALIEQLVERIVVGEEMIEVEWKFRG